MAIQQTYYLNGTTLNSSTGIFLDAELTICAPDGFYSDGTSVREQVGCTLLPTQPCPSCSVPCGFLTYSVDLQGLFQVNTEMGSATGAIVITFNPFDTPVGFLAEFGSGVFNKFSSPNYGLQDNGTTNPIYLGSTTSPGCDLEALSPITLTDYKYDGTAFADMGTTQNVSVSNSWLTGQVSPGECVMVIPKTTATPSTVNVSIFAACTNPSFNISIQCPVALRSFDSSLVTTTEITVCGLPIDQTYYVAHVNGMDAELGLYDWVFSDPNGQFILTDGFYKSPNSLFGYQYFQVANGIIVNFGTCV